MKETLEFVPSIKRRKEVSKLIDQGYRYICLDCQKVCKKPSEVFYNDDHGVRCINMCACGSDLFQALEQVSCLDVKVKAINGMLIFKEHHAKYCQCHKGQSWTGKYETECQATFELLREKSDKKIYKCLKSNLVVVVLKSTKEELENPDEIGSRYLKIPSISR